jgi:hypothetical protein
VSSRRNHASRRRCLRDLIHLSRGDVRFILMAVMLHWCDLRTIAAGDHPAPTTAELSQRLLTSQNLLGVNSCVAASCHGGGRLSEGRSFAAYQIWARKDPHATAFATLSNAESRQMVTLLHKGKDGSPVDATRDVRCLSCHGTTEFKEGRTLVPADYHLRDGVSCESCHGPAKKWLGLHSTREWKLLTAEQKSEHGFLDTTTDLAARVKMCADCHIGSPGRDVNHDLIAAGHPRLNFEFSAYYANLPKHWGVTDVDGVEPADIEKDPAFEARAWLTGQLVSSRTSLQLLQHRGKRGSPWPELAEYSCFSCHHDLKNQSWYQTKGKSKGQFAWGTWNYGTLPELLQDGNSLQEFEQLRLLMQKPFPEANNAVAGAKTLELSLNKLIAQESVRSFSSEELDQLALRMLSSRRSREENAGAVVSWDQTAQLYLANTALALASSKVGTDEVRSASIRQELNQIREKLMFGHPEKPMSLLNESPADYSEQDVILIQQGFKNIEMKLRDAGKSPP